MTTVCAVARAGRVVMGADSLAVTGNEKCLGLTKLIELRAVDVSANPGNPSVLLGVSGRAALIDAIRDHLVIDALPAPGDEVRPWVVAIACAIADLAAQFRLLDSDGGPDGNVLLGWAGEVWLICTSGAIRMASDIGAIGSGADYASGALYAIDSWPRMMGEAEQVEDAVRAAVTIASYLDVYSGGPPLVLSIP